MEVTSEKIESLKKLLPELYDFVVSITTILEKDLDFLRNISKEEIEKLDQHDSSAENISKKMDIIQRKADAAYRRLYEEVEKCEKKLNLNPEWTLSDFLSIKEVEETLSFNEKFLSSAIIKALAKASTHKKSTH